MLFVKKFGEVERILDLYELEYVSDPTSINIDFHQIYKLRTPQQERLKKELEEVGCKVMTEFSWGWVIKK